MKNPLFSGHRSFPLWLFSFLEWLLQLLLSYSRPKAKWPIAFAGSSPNASSMPDQPSASQATSASSSAD